MRKFYKNLSMKNKIVSVVLLICILTTTFISIIDFLTEISNYKSTIINNTYTDADLVSQYCVMPLEFGYPEKANEVLEKLNTKEYIFNGLVFDSKDSLFAAYQKSSFEMLSYPKELKEQGHLFEGNYIHVLKPIRYQSHLYGYIYLRAFTNISSITEKRFLIALALIGSMTFLAFILAGYLQRFVSGPILRLTNFTNIISQTKNYSLRITKENDDEAGLLFDEFNMMLNTIQKREKERDEALSALKDSEERFKTIVANIPGAVYRCKDTFPDWKMEYISERIEELSGFQSRDIISETIPFADLIHPEDRNTVLILIQECLSEKKPYSLEYRIINKDGKIKWVHEAGQGIFDENNNVLSLDGVILDISGKKQIELELQKNRSMLALVLNSVPLSVFWKDKESIYLGCNDVFAKAVGLKEPKEIIGKSDYDLPWPKEEADSYRADDAEVIKTLKPKMHIIEPLLQADGKRIWIDTKKVPLLNEVNKAYGVLGVYEDITEKIAAEKELTKYREHLEELVLLRTSELTISKEAAEAANKAKSEFLANMSHELRTPLNAVLGYTQILRRETNLGERQLKAINTIHRSGEHLLHMINEILDIAKIEAQKVEINPFDFDFSDFLDSINEMVKFRAKQKGIGFEIKLDSSLPDIINADRKRLNQILLNLLNNAIKFTKSGKVTFRVNIINSNIRFMVEDTGIGIAKEKHDEIFQAFFQIGELRDRAEGTGLGLAISRTLARLMKSELYVESELGTGSKFWFDLPLHSASVQIVKYEMPERKNIFNLKGDKKKILIVDDNQDNREVLSDILLSMDFQIESAINGREALEKLNISIPDIILMDILMPEMDGFETIKEIRKQDKIKNIIVIAISASEDKIQKHHYTEYGFDGFLFKPFQVDDLNAILREKLNVEWNDETDEYINETNLPLVYPEKDELFILENAAQLGDITTIEEWISRISLKDSIYKRFAAIIRDFLGTYDFEKIIETISPLIKELKITSDKVNKKPEY